jgi:hypothetical protein
MRWGRLPIPNLWLMPGRLLQQAMKGQVLYGIDGKEYRIGFDHIDTTLLFEYLAFGVKVDDGVTTYAPAMPPEEIASYSRGQMRRWQVQVAKHQGVFLA